MISTNDKLPPHNRDAERSLLGSMLRDNHSTNDVVHLVRADHFYVFAHQKIFEAITKLNDDGGKPADIVTVAEFLTQQKLLDEIGGAPYLAELWDAAPSAAHYRQYAEIVRQKAIVRNLIHTCNDLTAEAFDGQHQSAQDLLDLTERRILEVTEMGFADDEATHIADGLHRTWQAIEDRRRGASRGISTGFADLDEVTTGFQAGELTVVASRPSVGKTAFQGNVASHVAIAESVPVLFVSLEQSADELRERFLCMLAQVSSHSMKTGRLRDDEADRLFKAGDTLTRSPLYVDDASDASLTKICASVRRMKRRHGIGLVIIDYLQLITPDGRKENRQEQVATMSRRLKLLARELRIPIVVAAQLNRETEKRGDGRPKLSDLRESGAIEQDADVVILLHRSVDERGYSEGLIEAIVAKHRNGPTGSAHLLFIKQHMRFEGYPFSGTKGG